MRDIGDKGKAASLRMIVYALVGFFLTMLIVLLYIFLNSSMSRLLLESETRYLENQMKVADRFFSAAVQDAYRLADDIGTWSETVEFARDRNSSYIKKNWSHSTQLDVYQMNFVILKDAEGNDLFVDFYDFIGEKRLEIPFGFSDSITPMSREVVELYKNRREAVNAEDLVRLGYGGLYFYDGVPYLIATLPITSSYESNTAMGTITLGIILNEKYFQYMHNLDSIHFEVYCPGENDLLTEYSIYRHGEDIAYTTLPLTCLDGSPAVLVMTEQRVIYNEGKAIITRSAAVLAAAAVVFVALLYVLISRFMLRPVERLSADIAVLGAGGLDEAKYNSTLEFATLSASINQMIDRLNLSQGTLSVFQSILKGMDAYIYVTDPKTDELLFINDKTMELYGVDESVIGRPCYEVLGDALSERCPFCPLEHLRERGGEVRRWEQRSAAGGRSYQNTDWLIGWVDGREAHIRHAVDITDIKRNAAKLERRLRQQELMSEVSQSFISTDDLTALIDNALRMTGEFLDASKMVIASVDYASGQIERYSSWINPCHNLMRMGDRHSFPFGEDHLAYDAFITRGLPYISSSDATERPEYDYLVRFGVKAFVMVPVFSLGTFWGILTVDDCRSNREWDDSDIYLIQLIASVISELISRGSTEDELVRMSSIVDSSPQFISYMTENAEFAYVNQGAADICGYTVEELLDGGLRLILDDEGYAWARGEMLEQVRQKQKINFEMPIRRKDGERRVLNISVFNTGFRGHGMGVISLDVTDERRMELELLEAKEQAEHSSRAKGDFLSRMSHEMRTPMNAIIGMTSIARASQEVEKMNDCLTRISDASNHLLGVINDILDMSKIEADKFELSYSDFLFERMLMRVVNVIQFRIEEKQQQFLLHIDRDVPGAIVCDEQRLAQVITNLLSNAVKFTPEKGTISLRVRLVEERDGMCELCVEVRDTGVGITEEGKSRLFHPFEQADGGISRKFGGTGLGLAISKRIVEMMDGRLWVESEPGAGSTFLFTIRAGRGKTAPERLDEDVRRQERRLLAVDGSDDVLEYFQSVARSLGIACDTASGGRRALELLDAGARYDIVFVDWSMPDMNGIALSREIKERCGGSAVVAMISAAGWDAAEAEARAAGVVKYVPKPLFASLIAGCINECLGAARTTLPEDPVEQARDLFADYRMILAEDIEINREILIALLEPTGIVIDCAEDGRRAFDIFAAHPGRYDIIFMDIHMPEVDGYEATRMIRALDAPRAREIPIIAMTANVFREDIERCLAAGMNDHLGKPINMDDVIAKLRHYLHVE